MAAAAVAGAITSCTIEAAEGLLGETFALSASFNLPEALRGATWQVDFVVDIAFLKHAVPLGKTEPQDLPPGPSSMSFEAPGIDVGALKSLLPHEVQNLGLLTAVLQDDSSAETLRISILTQVYQEQGRIMRRFTVPS